jgi:cysteine-rich repeat protein
MAAGTMRWLLAVVVCGCGARSDLPIPEAEAQQGAGGCGLPCQEDVCGNGVVERGEECDLGEKNEDRPAILLTQDDDVWRPVMPVDRSEDAASFYDYFSESAHTGFEELDLSLLFLFRDTRNGRLDLFVEHGIDFDTTGVFLPHGLVRMDIDGLPPGAGVVVADEAEELFLTGNGQAQAFWEFWENTDGGVLGPLPFPGSWRIEHRLEVQDGIARWSYVEASGSEVILGTSSIAVLTAFATPSDCNTKCKIPRCGDGFVDGGEVCDDGNVLSGDGCPGDCLSWVMP